MRKTRKIIFIVLVIISLITGIVYANVEGSDKEDLQVDNSLVQVELNDSNCKYKVEDNQVTIKEYSGDKNVDVIVIPKKINGKKIESISKDAFEECERLEEIQINKDIAKNVKQIEDFEANDISENDKYVSYTTTKEFSEMYLNYIQMTEEEKSKIGIIPNKFYTPLEKVQSKEMKTLYASNVQNDTIPSSYDLRDYIEIKVESQFLGTCYAYSTMSTVETNLALTQGEDVDFSEVHMAVMSEQASGGNFYSCYEKYFSKGYGPVYEADWSRDYIADNKNIYINDIIYNYILNENVSTEDLELLKSEMSKTKPIKKVTKIMNFPSITYENKKFNSSMVKETRDMIKKHIMQYGGLDAVISMNDDFTYNGLHVKNSKIDRWSEAPHAVTIVGWDDNFSRDNFPDDIKPEKDGAYLALNSYGKDWGNGGYFWISYEDYFVETGLCGVVEVESLENDISISSMTIKDDENNTIKGNQIQKGKNISISLDVNLLNKVRDGETLEVVLRDGQNNTYNEMIQITGEEINNGKATLNINMETKYLNCNIYVIDVKYGGKSTSRSVEIFTDDFDFICNEDGKNAIISGYFGFEKDIEIPKQYMGLNITGIADYAFYNYNIESITVYENVKNIGKNIVLEGSIIVGESNSEIELYAEKNGYTFMNIGDNKITGSFWHFNLADKELTITGEMEDYNDSNNLSPWYNFRRNIYSISFGENVTKIGEYAFYYCHKVKHIIIPESVTEIKNNAFYGCHSMTTITLPYTLTNIGERAFSECSSLVLTVKKGSYLEEYAINCNIKYKYPINNIEQCIINEIKDVEYNGWEIKPEVVVKNGTVVLRKNEDYIVEYSNNINAGTATVKITGKRDYTGTITKTFNITGQSIEGAIISGIGDWGEIYTGKPVELELKIWKNPYELIQGKDYTLSYKNNNNVGIATVIITGRGNYTGTITKTFKIKKVFTKESFKVEGIKDLIYTGKKQIPNIVVKDGSKVLKEGKDYTITYNGDMTNPGWHAVNIEGIGYYTSNLYCEFYINSCEIKKPTITGIKTKEYTGKRLTQSITIKNGNTTLKEGRDYYIEYIDNKNVGKATMRITFTGNYYGAVTKYFYIVPKKVSGFKVKEQKTDSIKLSWSKHTGVSGYRVYSYNYKNKKWEYVGKTSSTSYTIKKLKAGTTYEYRVRAYKTINGENYYGEYTSSIKTSTQTKKPSISKLTTKSKKATISWKKVSGASGYEVYMATSKKGKYSKIKTITKGSTTSYTKSSLKKNKNCYFKIRTYRTVDGKKVYSSYSSVKSIKIK